MPEEWMQMNAAVTPEDMAMIDKLMMDDGYESRSAFVRRLIRQEWARRYSQPNPVTLGEAVQAGQAITPSVEPK